MNKDAVPAPKLPEGYTFSVVEHSETVKETKCKQWGPFWWRTTELVTNRRPDAVIVIVKFHGEEVNRRVVNHRERTWDISGSFPQRIASYVKYMAEQDHTNRNRLRMVKDVIGDYPPKKVIG